MKHHGTWLGLPPSFWAAFLLVAIVAGGAIFYVWLLDREDARAARERDGLPTIGGDELVPRAIANPGALRRQRRRLERERRERNPQFRRGQS